MTSGKKMDSLQNIYIAKRNSTHNFYRYNLLSRNKKLSVRISDIEGSEEEFTAGVYDFKNNKILHYENYPVSQGMSMCFATGDIIDGLAFCVYAGISGKTQGHELRMQSFEVWEEDL